MARSPEQAQDEGKRGHAEIMLRPEQLQVAIIGAGATGVELAAELHNTTRTLVSYGLDRIDPEKDMRLILIEAADRIVPALPPRLSDAAAKLLAKLNASLAKAKSDGSYNAMYKKWFGTEPGKLGS